MEESYFVYLFLCQHKESRPMSPLSPLPGVTGCCRVPPTARQDVGVLPFFLLSPHLVWSGQSGTVET